MINIKQLTHRYKDYAASGNEYTLKTVLDGVNLDIADKEFVVILGPNGSGKSTLAMHLNVLLKPDEGTVWVDGRNTAVEEELYQIRDCVGMVFQNPDNQIIGATLEEDCAFGLEMRAVESGKIQKRVKDSLETTGLWNKRNVSPSQLSGGQKQMAAIAGVVACRPRCIVLDEPTAMLDTRSRAEIIGLLHDLNQEYGITVILITHHTDEAVNAHRIYLVNQGRVVIEGTPQKIFSDSETLKRLKMDVPQVTAAAEELRKQGYEFSSPVLTAEQFTDEFMALLHKDGKDRTL